MTNQNNLPPLPEIPVPESSNVRLSETGEFNFATNLNEIGSVTRNWSISYQRLQSENPNAPTYQLLISSGVGTVAETLTRISTSASYEIGASKLFKFVKVAIGEKLGLSIESASGLMETDTAVYRYIDKTGIEANNLFSDKAQSVFGDLTGNPDSSQSVVKPDRSVVVIEGNNGNQTTTITATKTTNPSTGKSSVSISSSDYTQDQLTKSSASLFQNEGQTLVGSKIKIEGSDRTINASLLNDSLLNAAEKFLADNTSLKSPVLTIPKTDQEGSGNLYLAKSDKNLTLTDGSTSTLDTILKTLDSASKAIPTFLLGSANFGADLLKAAAEIFNNERPAIVDELGNPVLDANGNQTYGPSDLDYMIGEFVARIANGESAETASIDIAGRKVAEKISIELASQIGGPSNVQAGVAIVIAKLGLAQINGEDQNSDDYALVATQAILAYFGINPALTAAIVNSSKKILEEDGKFNSDGYQDVAAIAVTSFVVAAICIKIGAAVGASIGGPVGLAIGVAVGALVGYLLAEPVYNAVRNGWEDIEQVYDALEDMFKGDDIDDQLKEALKGIEDFGKTWSIDLVKDIGRGAIKLFTGSYGKEYGPGEYPNPYSYLQIIPKADGTGNNIIGIEKEGVVAIAREYYHDDLYGNSGSDNLYQTKNLLIF